MDFANILMNIIVFMIPFFILYFVIAAAVKRGIESSEVGRMIMEKRIENQNKKK